MGLESKVLAVVDEVAPRCAYFSNGSLRVEDVGDDIAEVILDKVREVVLCKVKMSKTEVPSQFGTHVTYFYDFLNF